MRPRRRALAAALAAGALALAGCAGAEGTSDAQATLPPNAVAIPLQGDGTCTGEATLHSSSDGWQNWPEGEPQYRLESPADGPQWSATATAWCDTRAAAEEAVPGVDWSIDGYLTSLVGVCPEPIEVSIEGWDARLCLATPEADGGGFHSMLAAIDDDRLVTVNVSVLPDYRGTNGTTPGDQAQAQPMLDAAEEALRHTTIAVDGAA